LKRLPLAAALVLVASSAGADADVFLVTELRLRDPHTYASVPFFGCYDVTDQVPLGLAPSFNDVLADALSSDGNGDGKLDLGPILAFLLEGDTATGWGTPAGGLQVDPNDPGGELAFHFASCSVPQGSSLCEQDTAKPVQYSMYANAAAGTCLQPVGGSTGGYAPAIVTPSAPCFVTDPFLLTLEVPALSVDLEEARIAATWSGDPPTALVNGLLGGFLSEAAADTTILSPDVPLVGGEPLSSILPGGTGCCASHDDRDLGPDGQTLGWWIYFNFQATQVTLTPTAAPVAGEPDASGFRLGSGQPNPFRDGTAFAWSIPRPGPVRLRVVDVRGRVVSTLVEGLRPAGAFSATWDGRARDGSVVGPGIYFVRLEWDGRARTSRVLRLR